MVLEVPLRQFSPLEQIVGSLRAAVGVASPGAEVLEVTTSLAFFAVSLFTFLLRPRQPSAQALLIIGTAFFYQHYYLVTSALLLTSPFLMRILALYEGWIWAILPAFSYLMLTFPHPKWPVRLVAYCSSPAFVIVNNGNGKKRCARDDVFLLCLEKQVGYGGVKCLAAALARGWWGRRVRNLV